MIREFKIDKITKKSESPFILTINGVNQLIGSKARALETYVRREMRVRAFGHLKGDDFLIEVLNFLDGVYKGATINIWG